MMPKTTQTHNPAFAMLLAEVRSKPQHERDAFLEQACSARPDLLEKLRSVLHANESSATAVSSTESMAPTALGDFGDYEILGEIARGGMGVVYRARQISLDRPVALKMIRESVLASDEEISRFRIEAESAAKLDHPNLVPIYEVGEEDGMHFFSMRLIEGDTLHHPPKVLKNDHRAITACIAKVARALQVAHQSGVLHRDLKPGNILIDAKGEPHIADFGLAKNLDSTDGLTLTGQVVGTPAYMAPEQAEGGELTTASDVYSLGAILYELLTGQAPFSGGNLIEMLRKVVEDRPTAPQQLAASIPRDLETITLKALEKSPTDRYQTAADFAQDLENWLSGNLITARPHSQTERLVKWAKRKPALAGFWGAATLFFFTIAIGGPLVAVHQKRQSDKLQATSDELRQELYIADMNRASQALNKPGGLAEVQKLISNWAGEDGASLRGWEWHYLRNHSRPAESQLIGGVANLKVAAWSPDGTSIAAEDPSANRALAFFDLKTHKVTAHFPLPTNGSGGAIAGIKFSPDGSRVLAHRAGGRVVEVYDVETRKLLRVFATTDPAVTDAEWMPGGVQVLVLGNKGQVRYFNVGNGALIDEERAQTDLADVVCELYKGRANRIAGINRVGQIQLWTRGEIQNAVKLNPGRARNFGSENKIDWSPDGRWIAVLGGKWGLEIWSLENLALAHEFRDVWFDQDFAFSPDSRSILSKGDHTLFVHSLINGTPLLRLQGPKTAINSLNWSPDGSQVLTAGQELRVWSTDLSGRIDDRKFFQMEANPAEPSQFAWVFHQSLNVGDALNLSGPELEIPYGAALTGSKVAWRPDGKEIAVSFYGNREPGIVRVRFYSPKTGELLRQIPPTSGRIAMNTKLRWSPDSNFLAAYCLQLSDLYLYDQDNREIRVTPPEGHFSEAFCWSHDGSQILMMNDRKLVSISVPDLEISELSTLPKPSRKLALQPSGRQIAIASDDLILILDRDSGEVTKTLSGHTSGIGHLRWSPDGTRLVSRSNDSILRIWDVEHGKQTCTIELPGDATARNIEWTTDGRFLLSNEHVTGKLHIFDGGRQ